MKNLLEKIKRIKNRVRAEFERPVRVHAGDAVKEKKTIVVVAILRDEDRFVEEWVAYHRILGVDHFYLYDNDPRFPLKKILRKHRGYVTVIEWGVNHANPRYHGFSKQVKAYNHYLKNYSQNDEWAAFIDVDEFIVLRRHGSLKEFLLKFEPHCAVPLNWHYFGHNGLYEDPKDLVISSLTRRRKEADYHLKTINKTRCVRDFVSAHYAVLREGCLRVDANEKNLPTPLEADDRYAFNGFYDGITDVAHINHYWCRSFKRWMQRPKRGDVGASAGDKEARKKSWKFSKQACLEWFVAYVAKDGNEHEDDYLLKYAPAIKQYLNGL